MKLWLLLLTLLTPLALGDITVTDDQGDSVKLAQPAARIVSLAPHITESLFAVGAGAKIVGTVSYSDFPEAAKSIPLVGSYDRISAEQVVALRPDLVIAWREGNSPATIERIRELGVPVYVTNPLKLDDIPHTLRDFSLLTGHDQTGLAVAETFEQRVAALRQRYGGKPPVTVFYQVWAEPLLSINDDNLIADVIRLCGGVNVFRDAIPPHPVVNIESVLQANPEVIIASGMGESRPDWLDNWRQWPSRAATGNHLYFVPPSLLQRHSTRIVEGAEQMCAHIDRARQAAAPANHAENPRD